MNLTMEEKEALVELRNRVITLSNDLKLLGGFDTYTNSIIVLADATVKLAETILSASNQKG